MAQDARQRGPQPALPPRGDNGCWSGRAARLPLVGQRIAGRLVGEDRPSSILPRWLLQECPDHWAAPAEVE
eukprot:2078072-Pyramimonas_sp.AAC.1